jgi:NADH-quinone oxidoreductase subunit N
MDPISTINPELLTLSPAQLNSLTPYFWVFGGVCVTILASVLRVVSPKWPVFMLTIAICLIGMMSSWTLFPDEAVSLFNGMMISDSYSHFFNVLFLSSALITSLFSLRYLDREKLQHPEYFVLLLFSALGMMLMTSALDLIVIFIALEIMSLAVYVLVGFRRTDRKSNEASMKYFILGSVASAVLLYGTALVYGATGSTGIKEIAQFVHESAGATSPLFVLGSALVLFGFLFKIAAVPFHMWMPDVYEGAPAPVTGFMTTGLKAAAFATLMRIYVTMGYGSGWVETYHRHIHDVLWVSAVATLVVGNFVALTQVNLKRMLAFSSIAHTGYLMVGIISSSHSDLALYPTVFYVAVYAVTNLGAFGILTLLSSREDSGLNLHDMSGVSRRHPWLAFAFAVFLLSMAGIPPLAGFAAKYLVFYSAVQAGEIPLAIIGVLCSAVSVYYYLRVIVYMYMHDPLGSPAVVRVSVWSGVALILLVSLVFRVGVFPSALIDLAKRAATSL